MQRAFRPTAPLYPPLASGRYYRLPSVAALTTVTSAVGLLRALPKYIPYTTTFDLLGAEVSTVGDAGSKVRIGVYSDDGTGRPGSLVLDAGTIAGDSATVQTITGLSLTLTAGWYWFAAASQIVTTTAPTTRATGAPIEPTQIGYPSTPGSNAAASGLSVTGVTGALPATFGTPAVVTAAPSIFGRVA